MDLLAVMDSREKSFRSLKTSRLFRFPRLNSVDNEVEAIIRLFPPGKRLVFTDGQVNEESFKALPLDRFKIIHIASHGYYDDDNWDRSGLLLGKHEESGEDGVLRPTDLYDVHLNSDLVVLSACQTAKGRAAEGMGLLGLSVSFLAAGTRMVLSSLWNIDDKSTVQFMDRFYRYLAEKKTISEALQSAKIDMIRSNVHRHPFFWAAFVLIGDGDTCFSLSNEKIQR
jgi:CHAT domain-containing protein